MGCPEARGPLTDYAFGDKDHYVGNEDGKNNPDYDAGFKNCAEPDAIGTYYSIVSNFEFE